MMGVCACEIGSVCMCDCVCVRTFMDECAQREREGRTSSSNTSITTSIRRVKDTPAYLLPMLPRCTELQLQAGLRESGVFHQLQELKMRRRRRGGGEEKEEGEREEQEEKRGRRRRKRRGRRKGGQRGGRRERKWGGGGRGEEM